MTFKQITTTTGPARPRVAVVVTTLGLTQILAWGSSYYLPAVLAEPIARDTGWSLAWVVGGLSIGLLIAGVASPRVGREIAQRGGRPLLALSAVILASGLVVLALSPNLEAFLLGWVIIGLGMAMGLYDPAFATLGRLYGERARSAITSLTLFGGFASTVCWPLTAVLNDHLGWRATCLCYAALHLLIALPSYWWILPREPLEAPVVGILPVSMEHDALPSQARSLLFVLSALVITLSSVVSAVLSVHMINILEGRGITVAAAVALGTLVGPSQVAARAIEMAIGRYHHPIWTKLASTSLVALGLVLLGLGAPLTATALMFYGAGIGLESIARGTLPLALFGPVAYPALMGRIARPSLLAQAAAPSLASLVLVKVGVSGALAAVLAVALFNFALSVALWIVLRSRTAGLSTPATP